ncbi:MAG TPA: hypothetical protein VMZ24_02475 [Patescibacteria group bacterium]|jgi:predicted flap endonuclease-1-like 5' DNA nuclease|nr:hypothetical protein [Patescibacteria group bacterium]
MKQSRIAFFWIGFAVSAATTTWLYWIWRKSRVVTPAPLVISRRESYQPVVEKVSASISKPDARVEKAGGLVGQPDELEAITGIGSVTAQRLNDAGIYTYKQLGSLTPERVKEISGTNRWDPNDWIDQARGLAEP